MKHSRNEWRQNVRKVEEDKSSVRMKRVLPQQFKRTKRLKARVGARS